MEKGWKTSKSQSKYERLKEGLGDDFRSQLSSLGKTDKGRALLLADYFLYWAETVPGRTLIAILALMGAWALL